MLRSRPRATPRHGLMGTGGDTRLMRTEVETLTVASVWSDLSGRPMGDDQLEWVPDMFAFTETLLQRSQAYRFAVSPPAGRHWPPLDLPSWTDTVTSAAERWCAWVVDRGAAFPPLVADEWRAVREGAATTLEELGSGVAWRLCEALLTLHAVADEACAGMGAMVATAPGGPRHRARAKELLARTGSLARLPPRRLRVLPKVRTPTGGISFRSLSRYACLRDTGIDVNWQSAPVRHADRSQQHQNVLVLPWPLRIDDGDFKPLPGSVRRAEDEPFGFFAFQPAEELDLDLVDRVVTSAGGGVDGVDIVILPESAVPDTAIAALEAVLERHEVRVLIAGVRQSGLGTGELTSNWVHLGVYLGGRWWHYRQDKHHRWFLDRRQIGQYQLDGVLDPGVRWWEAMAVPRRSVQFVELGNGITLVAVVCEDLARLDEVADLLRAVGPTLVTTILLDGPQLATRWTARYASILADDPGSAVLTLTSYGFVQRCRPGSRPPAPVVMLWKDTRRGVREVQLEPGAHGVLVTVALDQARRRAADGRTPVDNVTDLFVADVHQVRAAEASPPPPSLDTSWPPATASLEIADLTVLASWSDAAAEAVTGGRESLELVLADAASGASWRAPLGIAEPPMRMAAALAELARLARTVATSAAPETGRSVIGAAASSADGLTTLVATLLSNALESRRTG